ncbi:hypothetical protein ACHQM5_018140 [Ranunculus cassubicifolius]
MAEEKPTKPLTPPHEFTRSDEEGKKVQKVQHSRRHTIKCAGFCIAGILMLAILITVLVLTVFRVKEPEIVMKRITFPKFSIAALPATINIVAETAMKNPNIASFRYRNSTTFVYYHGAKVGQGHSPPGLAKARRTQDMNLSLVVVTGKVLENPNFVNELGSGVLVLSSYTRLDGRVKIMSMFRKHVVIKMNCTITTNITSSEIMDQMCKQKVIL